MTPAARVRVELADARARGDRFGEVWPLAVERALAGVPRAHEWEAVLEWASPMFAAAYQGRGQRGLVRAVEALQLAEVAEEIVQPHARPVT